MSGIYSDLLLSHPDMKFLNMNTLRNCITTTYNMRKCSDISEKEPRIIMYADEVPGAHLYCHLPSATKTIEGPFELRDKSVVRRKPYAMSHKKKTWFKQEVQRMLGADVIRPSKSSFAPPIMIMQKPRWILLLL